MSKIILRDVTLVGIDYVDGERLYATAEVCQKYIQFAQVKLFSRLPCGDNNIDRVAPINSKEAYSFFVMKKLYKYIDTKYLLIFQCDGFILNPFAWNDEFLKYDYIGAPWWYGDDFNVGNGGFSLRTRRLMEVVALDDQIIDYHPEDHFICRVYGKYLRQRGFRFAPEEIASRFSVEGKKWDMQFGFHKANISKWNIRDFTDSIRHAKYIDLFYQESGKDL